MTTEILRYRRWIAFTVVVCASQPLFANEQATTRIATAHHEWARFAPGAWRRIELISETVSPDGEVINRTATIYRSSLVEVAPPRYALEQTAVIRSHGREFHGPPHRVWRNMYVDDESRVESSTEGRTEDVEVDGKQIPCRVLNLRLSNGEAVKSTRLFYSNWTTPYILRRETHSPIDQSDESPEFEAVDEVVAVNMPIRFNGACLMSSHYRSDNSTPKGRTESMTIVSDAIPGGIISRSSKELDRDGNVIRRSYENLIDFSTLESERGAGRRRRAGRRGR